MKLVFQAKTSKDEQFYFNLVADGKVILKSEMYTQKRSRDNGIESVKKNSAEEKRYDREVATSGKHYFNLKASNGQVIGTSMLYDSEEDMESATEICQKAADAVIEEI